MTNIIINSLLQEEFNTLQSIVSEEKNIVPWGDKGNAPIVKISGIDSVEWRDSQRTHSYSGIHLEIDDKRISNEIVEKLNELLYPGYRRR